MIEGNVDLARRELRRASCQSLHAEWEFGSSICCCCSCCCCCCCGHCCGHSCCCSSGRKRLASPGDGGATGRARLCPQRNSLLSLPGAPTGLCRRSRSNQSASIASMVEASVPKPESEAMCTQYESSRVSKRIGKAFHF
uniref:Uncharacterized protein n=1 Tax=Rhipicephalus microplus TaxID=6941 RepID=A0A6G5AHF0_RHIMP